MTKEVDEFQTKGRINCRFIISDKLSKRSFIAFSLSCRELIDTSVQEVISLA